MRRTNVMRFSVRQRVRPVRTGAARRVIDIDLEASAAKNIKQKLKPRWKDVIFSGGITLAKGRRLLAISLAELIGTWAYIFIGCSSFVDSQMFSSSTSNLVTVSTFVFGFGTSVCIFNHISGSLFNPVLSLVSMITHNLSVRRCIIYILMQFIGGFLGVLLTFLIVPDLAKSYCIGLHYMSTSTLMALGFELFSSGILAWGLCGLLDKRRVATFRNISIKYLILMIPLLIIFHPLYGTIINPAYGLSAAVISGQFTDCWVFIAGPILGGVLGTIIYRLMFDYDIEERSKARDIYSVVEDDDYDEDDFDENEEGHTH